MNICLILHKYSVPLEDPCCYPLGYMYVAAHYKSLGHSIKVLNYNLWDYDLRAELKGQDIACFTGFEEFKSRILHDANVCLEMGVAPIVGGALSTFGALPEFPGNRAMGEIETCHIDAIPWPDYAAFDVDEYHKRHNIRYMGILSSRGCPYHCTFCAQTCNFRMRNLRAVADEIDYYLKRYHLDLVAFNDNTLNINKPRFMKICSLMKGRVRWGGAIRAFPFDEEMAKAVAESNCNGLIVGVESFNQDKLDRMRKQIKVKHIVRTLDLLEKYKIPYYGNLLVGFEQESETDIQNELLNLSRGYSLFPSMVYPFVGTKDGRQRGIGRQAAQSLSYKFREYAADRNKKHNVCRSML